MELKGLKINFLGDSITEGHSVSVPEKCYVSLLATKYGAICNNYGISGTRIAWQRVASWEPKFDQSFCDRVDGMTDDADVVMVFGGTNDYGHGDAPIGKMSDRTPETFYGGMHTLCAKLLTKYPFAEIIIATPLHRSGEDTLNASNNAPLKTYVDIVREVAEYYSLPVLDLYKNSGIQPELPVVYQRLTADGLHPNDAGHELLAKRIAAFIRAL
ncbi:MAG: SGNH/GDSL hydrolase family protein [Clostridia bacterium]|nr:SGNH/GDSL hydrolase family protein [Clostridia bacterium]